MREQGSGTIVNVSSITGRLPSFPMDGFSAASKHATGALSESLAAEVAPFGIKVVCIEPGYYDTALSDTVDMLRAEFDPASPYSEISEFMIEFTKASLQNGGDPTDPALGGAPLRGDPSTLCPSPPSITSRVTPLPRTSAPWASQVARQAFDDCRRRSRWAALAAGSPFRVVSTQ